MSQAKHSKYRNHRVEPYFSFLKNGEKTVEGRLNKGKYLDMRRGDFIQVFNKLETASVTVQVVRVSRYDSISQMLENEELRRMLPDVNSVEEGLSIYRRFYPEQQEEESGMVAIEVELVET